MVCLCVISLGRHNQLRWTFRKTFAAALNIELGMGQLSFLVLYDERIVPWFAFVLYLQEDMADYTEGPL